MSMYQNQPGMMGQPMYCNPYGMTMGTQYVQIPKAKNTQPLAADVINRLQRSGDDINWTVNQEDIWRAQCTHKDKNGLSTLSQNPDGSMHCNICGADFKFFDGSFKEVEETTNKMRDILQTIKTIYLDVPENFAAAYFQFLPLMDKIPQLWDRSVKCFSRYDQQMVTPTTGYTSNNWGILGQMTGNPMYTAGMYGAVPMYGQPMQPVQPMQPQMMPQQQMPQGYMNMTPMMAGQQQGAVPMQANPFVNGAVPMPTVPQAPAIPTPQQVVPQTTVAPQTPVQQPVQAPVTEAPAGNGEVVQQQTFKV